MLKKLLIIGLFISNIFATNIHVKNAYVRAVPPSVPNSASFMNITNTSNKDVYLESVNSNIASNIELHEHTMNNGMMKMQKIKNIKLPANSTVQLKPGGLHIMLLGLKTKLKPQNKVNSITLNFSNKTSIILQDIPIKSVMMGMKH